MRNLYFGPDLAFDLRDLAFAYIGLSDNYSGNAGKIKEKLQPALDELEAAGLLEPMSREDRYQKDGKQWKIRLQARNAVPPALAEAKAETEAGQTVNPLVAELITRGVTGQTAAELVQEYPAEAIRFKIKV